MKENAFEEWRKANLPANWASDLAGRSIDAPTCRRKVLRAVRDFDGLICDEAEQILDMCHQTCSARFSEMFHEYGYLTKNGQSRKTRRGRWAEVYVITDLGRQQIEAAANPAR